MDLFFVTCQFAKLCRRILDQFMPGLYGYDVFGTETVTLKVDSRCFKLHLILLSHFIRFVKAWGTFLELTLNDCIEVHVRKRKRELLSSVHVLHKK